MRLLLAVALAAVALPAQADSIGCRYLPYGSNPLGVFVKSKAYIPMETPIHVTYYAGGAARVMTVKPAFDNGQQSEVLTTTDAAFNAALANGTLDRTRGCTADVPISQAPPHY